MGGAGGVRDDMRWRFSFPEALPRSSAAATATSTEQWPTAVILQQACNRQTEFRLRFLKTSFFLHKKRSFAAVSTDSIRSLTTDGRDKRRSLYAHGPACANTAAVRDSAVLGGFVGGGGGGASEASSSKTQPTEKALFPASSGTDGGTAVYCSTAEKKNRRKTEERQGETKRPSWSLMLGICSIKKRKMQRIF